MTASRVVEHPEISEHLAPSVLPDRIGPAYDALSLEQLEEAVGNSYFARSLYRR